MERLDAKNSQSRATARAHHPWGEDTSDPSSKLRLSLYDFIGPWLSRPLTVFERENVYTVIRSVPGQHAGTSALPGRGAVSACVKQVR